MGIINLALNALLILCACGLVFYIGQLIPAVPETFVRLMALVVLILGMIYMLNGGGFAFVR